MLTNFQNDFYLGCEKKSSSYATVMLLFSLKMEYEWFISARVQSELQFKKTVHAVMKRVRFE